VTACLVTRSNTGIDDLAAVDTRHQAHDGVVIDAPRRHGRLPGRGPDHKGKPVYEYVK